MKFKTIFSSLILTSAPLFAQVVINEQYGNINDTSSWNFHYTNPSFHTGTVTNMSTLGDSSIPWSADYSEQPQNVSSPSGGGYLTYETNWTGWTSSFYTDPEGIQAGQRITSRAFVSNAGHFTRLVLLEPNTTYNVTLERLIQVAGYTGIERPNFTIWNAQGAVNPEDYNSYLNNPDGFFLTPGALDPSNLRYIAHQPYLMNDSLAYAGIHSGGWQTVDLTFTTGEATMEAGGNFGVPIAFMMGHYEPSSFVHPDYENLDTSVATTPPDGWDRQFGDIYYSEGRRYSIDNFVVTKVPEPSGAMLAGLAGLMAVSRRRR